MNRIFQARLAVLIIAVALIAAMLSLGAERLWRRISALEQQLSVAHLEAFHLASDFQEQLLKLNNLMLRYIVYHRTDTWVEFDRTSQHLKEWVKSQSPKLTSERERQLLGQLNLAYDEYLNAAATVRSAGRRPTFGGPVLPELSGLEQREQELLELSLELSDAHRVAKELFLQSANRSLASLRHVLLGGVILLILLLGTLGWVIYRDLVAPLRTRLVRSEELLRRQEKLATLGTLAAGIAHEIRNPLTSIKARLYTLGKHVPRDPLAVRDVAVIGSEIDRLERIVQNVLQFAKPADPTLVLTTANHALREVADFMAPAVANAGMHLDCVPGPDLAVRIDPGQMKQVLINLVQNAMDATEPGGSITLRVRGGQSNLNGRQQSVAILGVEDTGRGISPEVQKQLFDPFFTTKQSGSGLGLSIAARIAGKHEGALQYHTAEGRGTTFEIMLPLGVSQAAGSASDQVSANP